MEDNTTHDPFLSDLERTLQAAGRGGENWQGVLDVVLAHLGFTVGTIHRFNRATSLLELQAHTGVPDALLPQVTRIPIGKGMAGLAAQRGEPVQVCNLQRDETGVVRPNAKQIEVQGAIALPMFADGELRGVLGVAKPAACEFGSEEIGRLQAIATRIAGHFPDPLARAGS